MSYMCKVRLGTTLELVGHLNKMSLKFDVIIGLENI